MKILKSFYFWWVIIFIAGTLFAYFHADLMKGDYDEVERSIQSCIDWLIWVPLAWLWIIVLSNQAEN
jgi:hypothetical protein